MKIKFKNWVKHQGKTNGKVTFWFKFRNDFFSDPKVWSLDPEEIVTLLYLFCEASKSNTGGVVFINREHHRMLSRMQDRVLNRTIEKLQQLQIIEQPRKSGKFASVLQKEKKEEKEKKREERKKENISELPPSIATVITSKKNEVYDNFNPVLSWSELYKAKYNAQYPIDGKTVNILKSFAKGKSENHVRTIFSAYLALDESLYVREKHPLSLMFRDMAKISVAAQTGIRPGTEQLHSVFAEFRKRIGAEE